MMHANGLSVTAVEDIVVVRYSGITIALIKNGVRNGSVTQVSFSHVTPHEPK